MCMRFHAALRRLPLLALLLPFVAQAQLANVTPAAVDFGPVKMGAIASVPMTVYNLTSSPLNLAGGGVSSPDGFSALGGTCSGTLPANGSCTVIYRFQPRTASQAVTASTSLQVSSGGLFQTATIQLRGSGDESLAEVSPRVIDFGEELIGQTVTVPITITNTHGATLNLAGGGIAAPFLGMGGTPSCGGGLAPGASCQINYSFTPAQIPEAQGSTGFSFSDAAGLSQNSSIQLRGRGRSSAGVVAVAPVQVDFGDIKLGNVVEVRVRSTNRTASAMTRAGGGFNDNDNAFFGQAGGDPGCSGSAHPAGATCSTRYLFWPSERRAHAAVTTLQFSGGGNFESVPLGFSGRGIGRLARVSPVEIDFGRIRAGSAVTVPVTLTNTSPTALSNILGGNVTGEFTRVSSCGATLAPGASCTLTYRFQSIEDGEFDALTLLSYSNAGGFSETSEIRLAAQSTSLLFANGFE